MDEEIIEHIKQLLIAECKSFVGVKESVAARFQNEGQLSDFDIAFIRQEYRRILMKLWAEEFEEIMTSRIKSGNFDVENLVTVLDIFKKSDTFENVPPSLRGRFYQLIAKENDIFFPKDYDAPRKQVARYIVHEIETAEIIATAQVQKFGETLMEVYRNSYNQEKSLKKALKLQDFVNGVSTINDVAQNILASNFRIEKFDELKGIALNMIPESNMKQRKVQEYLREYLKDIIIKKEWTKDNIILKLHKKMLISKDLDVSIDTDVNEIHIASDVFHIDSDLPSTYRGKNLAIVANYVKIHKPCKFDLSGEQVEHNFDDAEQDPDGTGQNGEDGFAGKSGGNFALKCKFMDNAYPLTVVSNGSDGTNGQNGGNGKDGQNGKDATEKSFFKNNVEWKMHTIGFKRGPVYSAFGISGARKNVITTDDGLTAYVYKQSGFCQDWGMILVQGGNGQPGKPGGLGGCGGEGGHAGTISIHCDEKSHFDNITTTANSGKNGKDGMGGYNGLKGSDGRDLWKYASSLWKNDVCGGENIPAKFKVVPSENVTCSIWDGDGYVNIVQDNLVSVHCPTKQRNRSHLDRNISDRSKAQSKASIQISQVENNFTAYLQDSANLLVENAGKSQYTNLSTEVVETKHEFTATNATKSDQYVQSVQASETPKTSAKRHKILRHDKISKDFNEELQPHGLMERQRKTAINLDIFNYAYEEFIHMNKADDNENFKDNLDSFISSMQETQPHFLVDCIKNNLVEYKTDAKDEMKHADERILLHIYKEIYLTMKNVEISRNHKMEYFLQNIGVNGLQHRLSFMEPSKIFDTGAENLDVHFRSDEAVLKCEIIQHLNSCIADYETRLPESIIHLLFKYVNDIVEIKDILIEYINKIDELVYANESTIGIGNDRNERIVKEKLFTILEYFYSNKDVMNFMINDIEKRGLNSPIYKEILAHKYGVKLIVCIENLNNDLQIMEIHNNPNNLLFQYGNTDKIKEIVVLKDSNDFLLLCLNEGKYELSMRRELQEFKFNSIAMIMKDLNGNIVQAVDCDKELAERIKLCTANHEIRNNQISQIFDPQQIWISDDNLIELILSLFRNTFEQQENPEVEEIDSEKIRISLSLISSFGGMPILLAIAIRLYNNDIKLNLDEFSIIVGLITSIMESENPIVNCITFIILGNEQQNWITELLMMKLEDIFNKVDETRQEKWIEMFENVKNGPFIYLFVDKLLGIKSEIPTVEDMDTIIQNLTTFDVENYENFLDWDLSTWKLITTDKYWTENLSMIKQNAKINSNNLNIIFEDLKTKYGGKSKILMQIIQSKSGELSELDIEEFLYNFHTDEWKITDEVLKILDSNSVKNWRQLMNDWFYSDIKISNAKKIAKFVKSDDDTSSYIKERIDSIADDVKLIFDIKCPQMRKKYVDFSQRELDMWVTAFHKSKKAGDKIPKPSKLHVLDYLAIITRSIQLITVKNVILRETQLVSILTLWKNSSKGVLMQVSTGEGKTFIGVAFAILKFLHDEKLDIITSSSILAKRDATDQENEKIFNFFGISVDHNCHDDTMRRKAIYLNCDIIYGTLSNFQRDYLLTEFHGDKFIPEDHFQNILVDEVDSMLLDKGNNILYLSSSVPDIDEIEKVLAFIWNFVNQNFKNAEEAAAFLNTTFLRKVTLDTLYGILDEDDIKRMKPDINAEHVIHKLKQNSILDKDNLILDQAYDESKFSNALDGIDAEVVKKVKFLFQERIQGEKKLRIPKYWKSFILLHLNEWIESALKALILQNEQEYIVDRCRDGQEVSKDPNIIILDLDTGTDMTNSQWDSGLHQFLQFKNGCKLSQLSLKSVFISNASYFKKYNKLYGMTGTLGNLEERQKITKMHQIDFVTIPRYFSRKFVEYSPICKQGANQWLSEISKETSKILESRRSVLIICETIQETKVIRKELLREVKDLESNGIIMYQRDSEDVNIDKLQPGSAIIATNLAGRGTDIKLSDELKEAGGLHVILTYLPLNARIENQAFGRAARAGDKGSGRLIIHTTSNDSILKLKIARNQNELKRLDEISTYYNNFIKVEEEFFDAFHSAYKEFSKKNHAHGDIYLENFMLQWALWLDRFSIQLENWKDSDDKTAIQTSFQNFLTQQQDFHPVKRIEFFKAIDAEGNNARNARQTLYNFFQDDMIVFQYMKCYEMLKAKQVESRYNPRYLTANEKLEIKKCIKMLQVSINSRICMMESINNAKQSVSIVPIEAYQEQQNGSIQIYNAFIENLKELLGSDVNPSIFHSAMIDKNVMKNDLYEMLIHNDCIIPPEVSKQLCADDVRKVAADHGIIFDELYKFLNQNRGLSIKSMNGFISKLKEIFKLPSREEFWEILMKKEILKNEVDYVIIDMETLEDVDPSFGETLKEKFTSEVLAPLSCSSIFISPVNLIQKEEEKFIIRLKSLKPCITDARFKRLKENGVIEFNKQANFDTKRYEELKDTKIFEDYDEIRAQDFNHVCGSYKSIIEKLLEVQLLVPRNSNTYAANFSKLDIVSSPDFFEKDFVYAEAVLNLINSRFAYRFALEILLENVMDSSVENEHIYIHLHTNPHLRLVNDFLGTMIIDQAKVDHHKIDNCEEVLKNTQAHYLFEKAGLEVSDMDAIVLEIEDIDPVCIFAKYKDIQSTMKILLHHRKMFIDNTDKIKENLKKCQQPLLNEELEAIEVTLVPIDNALLDNKYISSVKSKGLDSFITVKQKLYSWIYIWRFIAVIAIGIAQILVGVALSVLFHASIIGTPLISQGINDIVFALLTLKEGHFNWSDYWSQKKESLIIEGITFGVSLSFTTAKWALKCAKNARSVLSMTGTQIISYATRQGIKETSKQILKNVVIGTGKALVQAGIEYGVDLAIESAINRLTELISTAISESVTANLRSHQIASTIDKLLEYINAVDLKRHINEKLQKFMTSKNELNGEKSKICSYVEAFVRSCGNETSKRVAKITSALLVVANTIKDLSMITNLVTSALKGVNELLLADLNAKQKSCKSCFKVNTDDSNEVKEFTMTIMKEGISNEITRTINSAVVKPLLTYGANKIIKTARHETMKYFAKRKQTKISRNAIEVELKIQNHINSHQDGNLPEDIKGDVNKILKHTKDPEHYHKLMKYDIPINIIGVAAAAVFFNEKFGFPVKIEIIHRGTTFEFGDIKDPKARSIQIDLVNGHYENSFKNQIGNNCLIHACAEQIPELRGLSTTECRNGIANVMLKNENIISLIKDGRKKFFIGAGFYGGARVRPTETAGTYGRLRYLYSNKNKKNRKIRRNQVRYHVDHVVAKSIYYDTPYEMKDCAMPSIRLEQEIHAKLHTTGPKRECKTFRQVQRDFLKKSEYFRASEMAYYDYQNAHFCVYSQRGYGVAKITREMRKMKNSLHQHINCIENKNLISKYEAIMLRRKVRSMKITSRVSQPFQKVLNEKFEAMYAGETPNWN